MHRPITLQEETRKPDKVRVLMFSGYSEENEGNLMRTASRVVEECKKKGIDRSHKKVKVEETPKPVEKIVEKTVEPVITPKKKATRKKRSTK